MRLLPLLAALALTGCTAKAEDPQPEPAMTEWTLLAIDGQPVDIPATLTVTDQGGIFGHAPCNGYAARNAASLPRLELAGIRATKRACDRLADEQVFFAALAAMDRLQEAGPQSLVLTGPGGRSMEFSRPGADPAGCVTCAKD